MQSHCKVTEREACAIASAFWSEFGGLDGARSVPSARFLVDSSRLCRTSHENAFTDLCGSYGLHPAIPITYVPVGLIKDHPVLGVADVIRCLSNDKKLDLVFAGHGPADYVRFWDVYRQSFPGHQVFKTHENDLEVCLPIQLHMDEGTSIKKRGLMVCHWGPCMGAGTSRKDGGDLNYLGVTIRTRFLYGVMMAKVYGGKNKLKPLLRLTEHLATELRKLFFEGVEVQVGLTTCRIFPICISLKADWAGMAKVGCLKRSFMSDAPTKAFGRGICHLCKAGMESHPWHQVSFEEMERAHQNPPLPWTSPSPLTSIIPADPSRLPDFFRVDIFHTCHKGIIADAAANAIEPQNILSTYLNLGHGLDTVCMYVYVYRCSFVHSDFQIK